MKRAAPGTYHSISTVGERFKAFIPNPMPPVPPLVFDPDLQDANDRALLMLGRLDSASAFLPDTHLFLYQYIRKEAVLSSQIEGTQSSFSDLLMNRDEYYASLHRIRADGDWESWLKFFLEAVFTTAGQGIATTRNLNELAREDRSRIRNLGRIAESVLRIHQELLVRPIASVPFLSQRTGLVPNTVNKALREMERLDIVRKTTGRSRNRLYMYWRCLNIMKEGTEIPQGG